MNCQAAAWCELFALRANISPPRAACWVPVDEGKDVKPILLTGTADPGLAAAPKTKG